MNNSNTSIATTCKNLIKQRVSWEATELAASNAKLYTILSACFDVYKQMVANVFLVDQVDKLLEANSIKFISTLHPANKLMKLIFGDNDRRRVSSYATVMRAAHEDKGKATADFTAWVKNKGGIEAIRTGNTTGGSTSSGSTKSTEAFTKADAQLSKTPAIITTAPSSKFPEGTGYVMVLARIAPDRSLSVVKFVGKVNDDHAKSQVIKVVASEEKARKDEEKKLLEKSVGKCVKKNKATEKRAIERKMKDDEEKRKWEYSPDGRLAAAQKAEQEAEDINIHDDDGNIDISSVKFEITYKADDENTEANVAA
ncbi:conserved hypothetical protein [Magnetospirillum sp. SS-4]|nr:conserved hypothetical protein [Magnetospirillum sp. SS-4]